MKGKRRIFAGVLAMTMAVSPVYVTETKAAPVPEIKNTVTLKKEVLNETDAVNRIIKDTIEAGERSFEVELALKRKIALTVLPLVYYKGEEELAQTSVFQLEKEGEPVTLYAHKEGGSGDGANDQAVEQLELEHYADESIPYTYGNAILQEGNYTCRITIPEQAVEGAKVRLEFLGTILEDEISRYVEQNTKQTADKLPVPFITEKDRIGVWKKDSDNTCWFKFTLPAKRYCDLQAYSVMFQKNQRFTYTLYGPKKEIAKKSSPSYEDIYVYNENGWYYTGQGYTGTLEKGTYYLKLQADSGADGYFFTTFIINGIKKPVVTYWASGSKVIKGTGEIGAKACAVINNKKYEAAKAIGSDGTFRIAVPKLKAGTDIRIYLVDGAGKRSSTVKKTVIRPPKAPSLTSYKAGKTYVKGKTIKNGTVKVVYKGKTYTKKTKNSQTFTIKLPKLTRGKKIQVRVQDQTGNVSAGKTYKIK